MVWWAMPDYSNILSGGAMNVDEEVVDNSGKGLWSEMREFVYCKDS